MTFYMQPAGAYTVKFSLDRAQNWASQWHVKFLITGLPIKWIRNVIILNWKADVNSDDGEDNAWLGMERWTQIVVKHNSWVSLQKGSGDSWLLYGEVTWVTVAVCLCTQDKLADYISVHQMHGYVQESDNVWKSSLQVYVHTECYMVMCVALDQGGAF